ncbi:MAG: glycosyltransferase [Chitinophagales bacterium]
MIVYTIIVLLLTVGYVLLFIFYLTGWFLLPEYVRRADTATTKVSVVIAARNEALNIGALLQDITLQTYPSHLTEIMVVDDFSTDDTAAIVSSFSKRNVKLLRLQDQIREDQFHGSFKKKALEAGITATSGELIITTDADCRMGKDWLATLADFYEKEQCHMVVAPVSFTNEVSVFEKLQSLDFLGMIGITAATLQFNFPVMCNGANLAFRRRSFEAVNGYDGINEVTSGDDVLLMQKIALRWKSSIHFLKNRDAMVTTFAMPELESFIQQRIRWTSKSKHYVDWRINANLLWVYLFNLSIVFTTLLCFFNSTYFFLLAFQLALKMIVEIAFLSGVTAFFNRRKLMRLFLPAQLFHIIYLVVIGTMGNSMKFKWKGRRQ